MLLPWTLTILFLFLFLLPDTFASVVLAVVASAVISPWALSLTLLIAQKERDRIHHEVNMSVRRTGAEHKYLEVDICCVNRWGLVDGLIDKVRLFSLSSPFSI